jgi:hypothetical protein
MKPVFEPTKIIDVLSPHCALTAEGRCREELFDNRNAKLSGGFLLLARFPTEPEKLLAGHGKKRLENVAPSIGRRRFFIFLHQRPRLARHFFWAVQDLRLKPPRRFYFRQD